MSFDPGYGQTPLPFEELDALLPSVRKALADPITKAMIYDIEQSIEEEVAERFLLAAFEGELELDEILTDRFLCELHQHLYSDIWVWAGQYRRYIYNIGIDWHGIPAEVRSAIETIHYRWNHTSDWNPRELGIAAHAELVRIHPFCDGNGRSTRLFADIVFAAAQHSDEVELYDWRIDKQRYIELLRAYDQHRDPRELAAFVQTYKL